MSFERLSGRAPVAFPARTPPCLAHWRDIDRQYLLPFGSPEEVRAAVRMDIDAFGYAHGGYIGRGEMAGDVPLENMQALLEELACYGVYPLTAR